MVMMCPLKIFAFANILFSEILSTETLKIISYGNYVSFKKIPLSRNIETIYAGGFIELKDSPQESKSYDLKGLPFYKKNPAAI